MEEECYSSELVTILTFRGRLVGWALDILGDWNTSEFTTDELFQAVIFLIQAAILEPKYQILGGVCIIDVANLSAGHAWYMTPTIAKNMLAVGYVSTTFPIIS